jgi:hypothetical protein
MPPNRHSPLDAATDPISNFYSRSTSPDEEQSKDAEKNELASTYNQKLATSGRADQECKFCCFLGVLRVSAVNPELSGLSERATRSRELAR